MDAERVLKALDERTEDVIDDPLTDANHSVPDALQDARYDVSAAFLDLLLEVLLRALYGLRKESSDQLRKAARDRAKAPECLIDDAAQIQPGYGLRHGFPDFPPVYAGYSLDQEPQDTGRAG